MPAWSIQKEFSVSFLLQMLICMAIIAVSQSAILEKLTTKESADFVADLTKLAKENNVVDTTESWGDEIKGLLHRVSRSASDSDVEIHRQADTVDPAIPCGSCLRRRRKVTISKPGCLSIRLAVPSCRGMCESWEIPHYEPPYFKKNHPVCRPVAVDVVKTKLRGCPPGQNPYRMISIPRRCACATCDPSTTACKPLF